MKQIFDKILQGERLSIDEVYNLIHERPDIKVCETEKLADYGYAERETIIQIQNRFFSLTWYEGRAKHQNDDYNDTQPIEVEKQEKVVTKTEVKWIVKN